jgi:hypothetical protein
MISVQRSYTVIHAEAPKKQLNYADIEVQVGDAICLVLARFGILRLGRDKLIQHAQSAKARRLFVISLSAIYKKTVLGKQVLHHIYSLFHSLDLPCLLSSM